MEHAAAAGRGREPPSHHRVKKPAAWLEAHPRCRVALLTLYYLGIIAGLIALYGRGDFSTPPFVYQEF